MKIVIGVLVAFLIGVGCRYFDLPVPSPPVLPGALLVVAITLGYTAMDRLLSSGPKVATTKYLCGGPTGLTIASKIKASEIKEGSAMTR